MRDRCVGGGEGPVIGRWRQGEEQEGSAGTSGGRREYGR